MRLLTKSFLILIMMVCGFQLSEAGVGYAVSPSGDKENVSATSEIDWANLTSDEILELTPKKVKERTGKKMNLKEKIILGVVKNKIKRQKKGKGFHVGGFLLGFFLGLIGVLIAYLAIEPSRNGEGAGISSLIGLGAAVALFLILVLILAVAII